MSHQIFGERFLTLRQPAWHNLGLVVDEELSAREALGKIGGDLNLTLRPMYYEIDGTKIEVPQHQIVRFPTKEDNEYVALGVVDSKDYVLFTPGQMCDIWDEHVGKHIETMGILRRGALFFCTTRLPTMDIKGDEVERYLGVTSPMDGRAAASAEEWDIRVVCANTLRAAQAQAKVAYRVAHGQGARERIGAWLNDAYKKAENNYNTAKEAFTLLADKRVDDMTARSIVLNTYADPRMPEKNAPDDVMEGRMQRWEAERKRLVKRREMAIELFGGDGTGMNSKAAAGTLWGLWNAVVELEDYRQGSRQPDKQGRKGDEAEAYRSSEDAMFGGRAATKQICYDACLSAAQGRFSPGDPLLN